MTRYAGHRKAREETKYLTEEFSIAIRRFGIKTAADNAGVKPNQVSTWLNRTNKATVSDQRIAKMAKAVGFEGAIFE